MSIDHSVWVVVAKSWGLFYLMAIFIGVLVYALLPSRRDAFDHAARSIIDDGGNDRPKPDQADRTIRASRSEQDEGESSTCR